MTFARILGFYMQFLQSICELVWSAHKYINLLTILNYIYIYTFIMGLLLPLIIFINDIANSDKPVELKWTESLNKDATGIRIGLQSKNLSNILKNMHPSVVATFSKSLLKSVTFSTILSFYGLFTWHRIGMRDCIKILASGKYVWVFLTRFQTG